jgi:hypothetical protein
MLEDHRPRDKSTTTSETPFIIPPAPPAPPLPPQHTPRQRAASGCPTNKERRRSPPHHQHARRRRIVTTNRPPTSIRIPPHRIPATPTHIGSPWLIREYTLIPAPRTILTVAIHASISTALRTYTPDIQIEVDTLPPRIAARSQLIVLSAVVAIATSPATPWIIALHTRSPIAVIVVVDVDIAIPLPVVVAVVIRAAVGRRVAAAVRAVAVIVGRLMAAIAIAVVVGEAVGTPEELAAAADVVEVVVRLATLVEG